MNYDRTCDTCRYHGSRGVCVCPKSEEFRDVTVNTYCCGQYETNWRKVLLDRFMKGAGR